MLRVCRMVTAVAWRAGPPERAAPGRDPDKMFMPGQRRRTRAVRPNQASPKAAAPLSAFLVYPAADEIQAADIASAKHAAGPARLAFAPAPIVPGSAPRIRWMSAPGTAPQLRAGRPPVTDESFSGGRGWNRLKFGTPGKDSMPICRVIPPMTHGPAHLLPESSGNFRAVVLRPRLLNRGTR